MAVESSWCWPLPPWFSPRAAWFIFFNVIVGAIAVSSRRKLTRSASSMVLERQRSVTSSSITATPPPQHHHIQEWYHYNTSQQVQEAAEERQVGRAEPEPESTAGEDRMTSIATPRAPAAPAADAAATAASTPENEVAEAEEKSLSLDEAHALAARGPAHKPPASAAAVPAAAAASEKVRPRKKGTKVAKRLCRWEAEEVERKAEVNARAERFIRQFREELRLQHINSIINYTNELRHGTGGAQAR